MKENVIRKMNNLCSMASYSTTMTVDDVNYWLEHYSDLIFCRGQARRVKFDKLTDKMYKVYSEAV